MKKVILIAASNALVCVVGCASPARFAVSEPVGPAPTGNAPAAGVSTLRVYSARVQAPIDLNEDEFLLNNDFGKNDFLYKPAHTDYTICSQDGKVLQHVRNARGPNDPEPAVMPLPPGTYKIEAKARDYGLVTIPVVIKPGKLTTVNLQQGRKPIADGAPRDQLVWLGNNRVVGWKATAASPAENQ